jgi:hypothetical protein
MIKPDWNKFKSRFSETPQDNFEWLCYLLFCREHNRPIGIFRYKNQAGIETNPLTAGDEVIGWQAKFYETKPSDQKEDIINTLTTSKIPACYIEVQFLCCYVQSQEPTDLPPRVVIQARLLSVVPSVLGHK